LQEKNFKSDFSNCSTKSTDIIRVGYLSADLCQHTVGLFLLGILQKHSSKFSIYSYQLGPISDSVTEEISLYSQLRNCHGFSDVELIDQIRSDCLHVVIDLSGHTGGSRTHILAARLASIQLSWLGYTATTGLTRCDGILLDSLHIDNNSHLFFTEPIISLGCGRLCYKPVNNKIRVGSLPAEINGFITFGSFNNTAKYNDKVFYIWAQILKKVIGSRLILKWKTFHDPVFVRIVSDRFNDLGIDSSRICLRGFSAHEQMLLEYGDIDIALDPFPFSGGLTSCEALWMGVPVITMPLSRVASRQTYAFLTSLGMDDFVATDPAHYVELASYWSSDFQRLAKVRRELRGKMESSPLMDIDEFTLEFERILKGMVYKKLGGNPATELT
jgi:protein O-GlcNAc transferase